MDISVRGEFLNDAKASVHGGLSELSAGLLLSSKSRRLNTRGSERQEPRIILGEIFEEEILVLLAIRMKERKILPWRKPQQRGGISRPG